MHPEKKSVAIDYGLAIIMLPTVMMGSFIGVIMNAAMPTLILQICLTLLLGFLTVQSAFKATEIMKKENEKLKAKKKETKEKKRESNRILGIEEEGEPGEEKDLDWDNDATTDPSILNSTSIVFNSRRDTNVSKNVDSEITSPKNQNAEEESPYDRATPQEEKRLENLLKREGTHFQWDKHAVCLILLISNVLVTLMRGSKKSGSIIGTKPCDVVGWLLVVIFVAICSLCTFYGIKKVSKEQ